MPTRKFNHEELIELRHSGLTIPEIAKTVGANRAYINRLLAGVYAIKECEQCGKEFSPTHSSAIYCCTTCKVKAWRMRNRGL